MDEDFDEDDFEELILDDDGVIYEEEPVEHMLDDISLQDQNNEEIEEQIIDVSSLTLQKHKKAVFSSALSKDDTLAITGGEDDIAYLWNTETGEVLFEFSGHKDSVTEVHFNFDGQYVATGDMAGMIQVWSLKEKKLAWCYEGDDLEWLKWHPLTNALFCGCHSGDIYLWQIPQGNCKVLVAQNNSSTTCGVILPNGKQILAGYDDGNVRLWNIKECSVEWSNNQAESVTNLDINQEGTLAISAPESRLMKLSDGKTISILLPDGEKEVEVALFNSTLGIIASGSISGHLCVWELGKQTLRHQAQIECAVTVMKWGNDGKIFIGAADGAVYVCDVKSGSLLETLTGHQSDILSISMFNNSNKILTTSDDGTAKIFTYK
uniref:Angio-associated migratory cell protein isoform X1 n=1 Tax=Diabrotica virgifera virgifera TaxID=50390 RepID=A0A6P7GL63_DIAVI